MAGKLSSDARMKIAAIEDARRQWDRIYALVEQLGSPSAGDAQALSGQIARAAQSASRMFLTGGLGTMATESDQLAVLARRGGSLQTKIRMMREVVASVRLNMERSQRAAEKDGQEPIT